MHLESHKLVNLGEFEEIQSHRMRKINVFQILRGQCLSLHISLIHSKVTQL